MKKLIIVVIGGLIILGAVGAVGASEAAKEFVCTIKSDGSGDYTSLATWQTAVQCDLTAGTTRVFSWNNSLGSITDSQPVTGFTSNATAMAVHVTSATRSGSNQILLKSISGTFLNGEKVRLNSAPASNYVTLNDNGNPVIATAKIMGTWTAREGALDIAGWTTSANNYVNIYADTASRAHHPGKWSANAYRLEAAAIDNNGYVIRIESNNVRIKGLQVQLTNTGNFVDGCRAIDIQVQNQALSTDVRVEQCIVKGIISNDSSNAAGIYVTSSVSGEIVHTFNIFNNLIYDFVNNANDCYGINIDSPEGKFYLYNNTVYNCYKGINIQSDTGAMVAAKNNICNNPGTGSFGPNYSNLSGFDLVSSSNNISEDSTSPNSAYRNKAVNFVDITQTNLYDFHLTSTDSIAKNKGTNQPPYFTDDIDGNVARSGIWDIGCSEYAKVWIGGADTSWNNNANWSGNARPAAGDIVIFTGTPANNCILDVSATVAGFINTGDYTGTFSTGNNLTITGNFQWKGSGTFTAASPSTVTFSSASIGNTILSGGAVFYNFAFIGVGGGWTIKDDMLITNDLTLTSGTLNTTYAGRNITIGNDLLVNGGTLSGGANITVNGGDVTGGGTINLDGGKFTLTGVGNFGGTNPWTFYNLTFGDGLTSAATSKSGANKITIKGELNVSNSHTLNAGTGTWNLSWALENNILTNISQIAGSGSHVLALKSDGTVYAWGMNNMGQIGDGTHIDRVQPVQVQDPTDGTGFLTDVKAIAAGGDFSLALKNNGNVWAWGNGGDGQLGNGVGGASAYPVRVSGAPGSGETWLINIKAICASSYNSFALRNNGRVYAWGGNDYGQAGDGTNGTDKYLPVMVKDPQDSTNYLTNITAIAVGGFRNLALKNDGTVYAWGSNVGYAAGDFDLLGISPSPGTFINAAKKIPALSNIIAITAGSYHAFALKNDGTVYAWGNNWAGQLGTGDILHSDTPKVVSSFSQITAIEAGGYNTLAIKSDGTIWACGWNTSGQLGLGPDDTNDKKIPTQVIDVSGSGYLTDVKTIIVGGSYNSYALKNDGTVLAWADNSYGQLGIGNSDDLRHDTPVQVKNLAAALTATNITLSDFKAIAAGVRHTLILKNDGTVWAWGIYSADGTKRANNRPTQVVGVGGGGFLTGITAIAAGGYNKLALKSDGAVYAWGGNVGDGGTSNGHLPVSILANVKAIATGGGGHSLALKNDDTVWAWGSNAYGQLGNGGGGDKNSPVQVTFIPTKTITAIAVGTNHSLAIASDNTVYAWGDNAYGQLGNGLNNTNSSTPVQVSNLNGVTAIAAGDNHSLALKDEGTVLAWGYNAYGQLGIGSNDTGIHHSPTPVNGGPSGVTAISAGGGNSFAIAGGNSDAWSWGLNSSGQLGDNSTTQRTSPVQVQETIGPPVTYLSDVKSIAIGSNYNSFAVKNDGTVYSWGYDPYLPAATPVKLSTGVVVPVHRSLIIDGAFDMSGNPAIEYSGDYVDPYGLAYSAVTDNAKVDYYDLKINGTTETFVLLDGPVATRRNMDIASGILDVGPKNTAIPPVNYGISCAGNWTNTAGTFVPRGGTVTLSAAGTDAQIISGDNTFYNLTKIASDTATLFFQSAKKQTVDGTLTLKGAPGKLLSLRSNSSPVQWKINPIGARDISYVDVQDSYNMAASIAPQSSKNSGNNYGWIFPTVSGVTSVPQSGSYKVGDADIDIKVQFSDNVLVDTTSGIPAITLETGASDAIVNYFSGSSTDTLVFRYKVRDGDNSSDLDYVNTGSLALNGGIITDLAKVNNAVLTLAASGAPGSLGANSSIAILTGKPIPPSGLALQAGGNVTNNPTPVFIGNKDANCSVQLYEGGTLLGSTSITATTTWAIASSSLLDNTHNITATATDAAGNISDPSAVFSIKVDTAKPTLSSWSLDMNTQTMELTFNEPVAVNAPDIAKFTLRDLSGGKIFTLAGAYSSGTYGSLTAGKYAVGSGVDNVKLQIKLAVSNFNAIIDIGDLCNAQSTSYLTLALGAVLDIAGNNIDSVTLRQVSTWTANSVTADKFRITPSAVTITAGTSTDITIKAYDVSGYRAPYYTGEKILTFSGAIDSPDANKPTARDKSSANVYFGTDTTINFSNGQGASAVTLYCKTPAGSPASVTAVEIESGINTSVALSITVNPKAATKLVFSRQPSSAGVINAPLAIQPKVSIRDEYGNQTADTFSIKIDASLTSGDYSGADGALSNNIISAINGEAVFANLKYNAVGAIYLYADRLGTALNTAAYSDAVSIALSNTSTVASSTPPQSDFALIPINDTLSEKFAILKFKITDAGEDSLSTLIDQIEIVVMGGNASTDIAWAGLYKGAVQLATATGIAVTNSDITFGSSPNADSVPALDSILNGQFAEYTVYIYMKNSKLTATDGQTCKFKTDGSLIGTDTGASSQMLASSAVSEVAGTITVIATHLELVDQASGNASCDVTAGAGRELRLRATDSNRNIDKEFSGVKYFIFSGLNTIGGYSPKIENKSFGQVASASFPASPGGISLSNAVTLTAYKKETGNVYAMETDSEGLPFIDCLQEHFDLAVTVSAAAVSTISKTSGDSPQIQTGVINKQLANPFVITTTDLYTNPIANISIIFNVNQPIRGSTLTTYNIDTKVSPIGQASTILTLGNAAGDYVVTASSLGLSPVTFTAAATAPSALNKDSGDVQSGSVGQPLSNPFVVKLVDAVGSGISGETISFSIFSSPPVANGQELSTSLNTDTQGLTSTILTLGDKTGPYVVRATYQVIGGPLLTADFAATATTAGPYKVVLSGPTSVNAGDPSGAFTIGIQDQYGNPSKVSQDTVFTLAVTPSTTGNFYSDAGCTLDVSNCTVTNNTSTGNFYYKDPVTGSATITSTWFSGEPLNASHRSSSVALSVVPANLHHLTVTAANSLPMTTGESRTLTIKAYDALNNFVNNYSGSLLMVFAGANPSPAPSNKQATWNNTSTPAIKNNFGTSATLQFTNGVASVDFIPCKAEAVNIAATSGSITNPDVLALTVKHGDADHLKFHDNLPTPQIAGTEFNFDTTLDVVDLYDNICDGANGAAAYTDTRNISWTLTGGGVSNGPDSGIDSFVQNVSFTGGRSNTELKAKLHRAQNTTIIAGIAALTGTNVASNVIKIDPANVTKMRFAEYPANTALTNQAFATQPKVAIADQFGNSCSNVNAQITLNASTTSGSYVAGNGILSSPAGLTTITAGGEAVFTGVKYSYPETIYLRAQAAVQGYLVDDVYSFGIALATAADLTVVPVTTGISGTISSIANTAQDKVGVFAFKVTDAGTDGYGGEVSKVVIRRDAAAGANTIDDWTQHIGTAYLSDGVSQPVLGAVTSNTITFGDGSTTICSVPNYSTRTYTLSLVIKNTLPEGADNLKFGFTMDAFTDITLNTPATSTFTQVTIATHSAILAVTASKLNITETSKVTPVTMNAGEEKFITLKAMDTNGNIDKDYNYTLGKNIIFSGASVSDLDNDPTCSNYVDTDTPFGSSTAVKFINGISLPEVKMKLYKAETTLIMATDDSLPTALAASGPDGLRAAVSGGTASALTWNIQPNSKVVANAPWREFVIAVSDAYGNTASTNIDVKVTPNVGSKGAGAIDTVPSPGGLARFNNFSVSSPGDVKLTASGVGMSDSAESDEVTVDEKYNITFNVKDSVNAGALDDFVFSVTKIDSVPAQSLIAGVSKNSPFNVDGFLGYGKYSFKFTKELPPYVDQIIEKTLDTTADGADGAYDNNIKMTVYMMTVAEATADYRVMSSFIYDEMSTSLAIKLWLDKRGKLIFDTFPMRLGRGQYTATIEVLYDEAAGSWTAPIKFADPEAGVFIDGEVISAGGSNYTLNVSPLLAAGNAFGVALTPGKTYFAKCKISYGGVDGAGTLYTAGANFTVTVTQKLAEEVIMRIGLTGSDTIAGKMASIEAKVDAAKTSIENKIDATKTEIKADTARLLTATETTIPAQIKDKVENVLRSEILNRESTMRMNTTFTVRYRTYAGLEPIIEVYDQENKPVALSSNKVYDEQGKLVVPKGDNIMRENVGKEGKSVTLNASGNDFSVYTYDLKLTKMGDYTIVCSEPVKGTMDAMMISVIGTNIEDVAGQVSAIMGTTSSLSNLKDVADTLNSQFSIIESALSKINTDLVTQVKGAASSTNDMDAVFAQLLNVSKEIKGFAGTQNMSIDKLYEVTKEKKHDIKYLKNKTQELKAVMDINQKMIDNMANKPVTQTWFEYK